MVSTEENRRSSSGRHGLAACTCGWMPGRCRRRLASSAPCGRVVDARRVGHPAPGGPAQPRKSEGRSEPQARGWARNCPCCSSRGGCGAPPGRAWTPEPCARSRAGHVGLGGPRARPREGRSVVRDRGTPDACGGPPRSCEPKPRGPSAVATQGRMRVAEAPGRRSPIRGRAGRSGR